MANPAPSIRPQVDVVRAACTLGFLILAGPGSALAAPGDDHLISVSEITGNAAGGQIARVPFSGNGRYVLFYSTASNILPGDTNGVYDVYLRDLIANTTERISVGVGGAEPDGHSGADAISDDGRYVVFGSSATNIVADGASKGHQIYVRDRVTGQTSRAFIGATPPETWWGSISDDGRFVVFSGGDENAYITDRVAGTTTKIGPGLYCEISGNGRYVLLTTPQANSDLYLWDRLTQAKQRITKHTAEYWDFGGAISDDGRWVSFQTYTHESADDQDDQYSQDVFLWDRLTGVTKLANVSESGVQDDGSPNSRTAVSNDGRYVGFASTGTNLVDGATTSLHSTNIHVKDMQTGAVERVSGTAYSFSLYPAFSDDNRLLGFTSTSRFAANDGNAAEDTYTHEIGRSSTSLPDPGYYLRPRLIDFGQVVLGTSSKKGFTLKNPTSGPLPITTVEILGVDRSQYALKSYCGATLAAGQHCWISVTFRPTSLGYKQANLHVIAGGVERHRALRGTAVR